MEEEINKNNEVEAEKKFSQTQAGLGKAAKFFVEFLETAIIIGLIAFVIRFFLVQPFVVEGASMEPNFHNNDYLLIEKITDRLNNLKRGDVIVFRYPNNPKVNYIKRIIGLPGDKVTVKDGSVKINGQRVDESYLPDDLKTNGDINLTLEDNQYFVLGDNRNNSSDSREWGILPKNDIIGRAWLIVLPANDFGVVPRVNYGL